jgi:hypothetical protein
MNPRAGISILVCCIGILSVHAQSVRKDSLQRKKDGEIYINQEAVKSIEFNFMAQPDIMRPKPMMDETKPWMEFRKDLPMNLTDTTTLQKKKYIRMLPYSIWGHDDAHLKSNKDTLIIRMKLNLDNIKPLPGMGHGYRVVPGGMDQSVTPSNNPIGGFSADKLLFENFTKRGRAIKRNRKKAKAWKTYKDYVPTKEDSLKWYKNKKRIPEDTLTITVDSMKNHFMNTK